MLNKEGEDFYFLVTNGDSSWSPIGVIPIASVLLTITSHNNGFDTIIIPMAIPAKITMKGDKTLPRQEIALLLAIYLMQIGNLQNQEF